MKKLFIVANWKSHKTIAESISWIQQISNLKSQISNRKDQEIIVCPSFTLLSAMESRISLPAGKAGNQELGIKLGAQDISPFEEGAYTGEVNGRQIKELADYVLIGHSERRMHFHETDEVLKEKVSMARAEGTLPIFCVQDEKTSIPEGIKIVAYEPVEAIGTGNPDNPDTAEKIARTLKSNNKQIMHVLYGGSVDAKNVKNFTSKPHIDGVLVGGASLDAHEFSEIIKKA